MAKTVWRNGAPSTRNPPKDAPEWTTDTGVCTKINIVINPRRMHEGYGSRFMRVLCVCLLPRYLLHTWSIFRKQGCWLSLQICNMIAIAGVHGYSYCNTPGNLHYSVLYYRII